MNFPNKKHAWAQSIPDKPCTKYRLLLAEIGGSLEQVLCGCGSGDGY